MTQDAVSQAAGLTLGAYAPLERSELHRHGRPGGLGVTMKKLDAAVDTKDML